MLCRKCGHGIVKPVDFISVPTAKALRQRNDTISAEKKTLIQLLENPQGDYFSSFLILSYSNHQLSTSTASRVQVMSDQRFFHI